MGLDMYLEKVIFIGAEYEARKITGNIEIYSGGQRIPVDLNKVSYIYERTAYWRKANAIHQWFVKNFAGGEDACHPIYLFGEDLLRLRELCRSILAEPEGSRRDEKARELLPPQEGFFFGSTKIDEWYYHNLEYTLQALEGISEEDPNGTYEYHASW